VSWKLVFAEQALKDAKKLAAAGLKPKAQDVLAVQRPLSKSATL